MKYFELKHLKFEFVSNFVLRYSNFHPCVTQTTGDLLCERPDMGHGHITADGWESNQGSLFGWFDLFSFRLAYTEIGELNVGFLRELRGC